MNQLTRNRLIGGAILVFAGALFVPAILSPTAKTLDNPQLAISIKGQQPTDTNSTIALTSTTSESDVASVVAKSAITEPTLVKPRVNKPLALESLTEDVVVQQKNTIRPSHTTQSSVQSSSQPRKQTKNQLMPVALESIEIKPTAKTSKPSSAVNQQQKTNSTAASWLRLGSFSSQANAEKLAATLQSVNYPVKIERIAVDGKSFQRVLVGPFYDEKKMETMMKGIQARGYTPSVQR